jgi:hypothetical protein
MNTKSERLLMQGPTPSVEETLLGRSKNICENENS